MSLLFRRRIFPAGIGETRAATGAARVWPSGSAGSAGRGDLAACFASPVGGARGAPPRPALPRSSPLRLPKGTTAVQVME